MLSQSLHIMAFFSHHIFIIFLDFIISGINFDICRAYRITKFRFNDFNALVAKQETIKVPEKKINLISMSLTSIALQMWSKGIRNISKASSKDNESHRQWENLMNSRCYFVIFFYQITINYYGHQILLI